MVFRAKYIYIPWVVCHFWVRPPGEDVRYIVGRWMIYRASTFLANKWLVFQAILVEFVVPACVVLAKHLLLDVPAEFYRHR